MPPSRHRSSVSRRAAALAATLVLSLAAAACTDGDAAAPATTAAPSTTAPANAVPAKFRAFGSIGQANVMDAPPGTEVTLRRPDGSKVATARTDKFGSLVFRYQRPGKGYVAEQKVGDKVARTPPFAVLSERDTPPQSLYTGQRLTKGLNYVKMRDGVELAITVRLPPGKALTDGPFPTVLEYSGYEVAPPGDLVASLAARITNPDAPSDPLAPSSSTAVGSVIAPLLGFAVASVQIRGSGCSGGEFDLFGLPTIYDGYDAVETVAAQPWVKGSKVGMVGISYSGYSQLFVGGTRPPHLAALAPMSVLGDMYDGIGFPGGIFNNGFAQGWLTERQHDAEPAPGGGQPWATTLIERGDTHCRDNQKLRLQTIDALTLLSQNEFRDPLLYARRTPADWAERIDVPVFLVGGLQDEQLGSHWVNVIERLEKNPDVWVTMYNGNHNDALGPEILPRWVEFLDLFVADQVPRIPDEVLGLAGVLYEQIGSAKAPALQQASLADEPTVAAARKKFEDGPRVTLLADVGAGPLGPHSLESTSQVTFDEWPPPATRATRFELADKGRLVPAGTDVAAGSASYVSDPSARPKFNLGDGDGVYAGAPDYDWKPVVDGKGLGWTTAPLTKDLLVLGPSSLDLRVSSSDADADLQVTLSEVRPDGAEVYLTSGWLRLSGRKLDRERSTAVHPYQTHTKEDAAPLTPGELVNARVPINPVGSWLRKGSRLRVTVLAPGGDVPSWNFRTVEKGGDKVTVAWGGPVPSRLVLPVVGGRAASTPLPACGTLRGQPCRLFVPAANGG